MTTETWSARVDWADEYTEQLAATPQGSTAPDSDHRCKKKKASGIDGSAPSFRRHCGQFQG